MALRDHRYIYIYNHRAGRWMHGRSQDANLQLAAQRTTAHTEFGDLHKERQERPFSCGSASAGRPVSNSSDRAAEQPSLPAVVIDGYCHTAELTFSGASRIPCSVRIPQCCMSRNGSTPIPEAAVPILPGEHLPFPSPLRAEDYSILARVDSRTSLNRRRARLGSYWRWEKLDSEWKRSWPPQFLRGTSFHRAVGWGAAAVGNAL